MLSQTRIAAAVFLVADLDRTVAFYRETLGMNVSREASPEGDYAVAQLDGNVLVFFTGQAAASASPIVVFGVESGIEDIATGLAERGVEFVVPVSHAPDGGLTADFTDPDGHTLSLYQAP